MGHINCVMPPMPDNWELKEQFELRAYPSTLNGWGAYFMALGALEEIDGDNWLSGQSTQTHPAFMRAHNHIQQAKDQLRQALDACLEFRSLLPEESRNMLSVNIRVYHEMITMLDEADKSMGDGVYPPLETLHRISELIREDMIFGERMSKLNRGRKGHYPVPEYEDTEITEIIELYEAAG